MSGVWAGIAVMVGLLLPASAGAATIAVDGDVLRYSGDEGADSLILGRVENGELLMSTEATAGSGCREREYGENGSNELGNRACSLAGVTRMDVITGAGSDEFDEMGGFDAIPVPMHIDTGSEGDRVSFASIYDDEIDLGDGGDSYVDAPGNDHVDAGPGPDNVYGGDFSTGDDTIVGGDGDDNLDGRLGDDSIDAGPGNDILQPGEGDDVMDGGDGDDYVAGDPSNAGQYCGETGNDVLRGGAGADLICAGQGSHTIDGGPGPDSISSLDGAPDADVACGDGTDVVWADAFDPVALDCERQGQDDAVHLNGRVLNVPLPCASRCNGELTLFAAPDAPTPVPGRVPSRKRTKVEGKALAQRRFKRGKGKVKVRLARRPARRLRKLGATTLEARTELSFGGGPYVVRRTFPISR
jgi:Ca2+-binding RTX toxin-like protein